MGIELQEKVSRAGGFNLQWRDGPADRQALEALGERRRRGRALDGESEPRSPSLSAEELNLIGSPASKASTRAGVSDTD